MTFSLFEIEQQASQLLPSDRAQLAEFLLESLQEPMNIEVEQAWGDEIERRVKAYENGEAVLFPAQEVFAEARRVR